MSTAFRGMAARVRISAAAVGDHAGAARFAGTRFPAAGPVSPLQPLRAQRRAFGAKRGTPGATTDGPFRYIKPSFVEKKKHYTRVLVMGDRRFLLETAQDVLNAVGKEYPRKFWEVFGKRCVQSMHLLEPLELAIVARAFDAHGVELEGDRYDVYSAVARRAREAVDAAGHLRSFPGLAIIVLADVLPRRLAGAKADLTELLKLLGRQAADVMWELSPMHAIGILAALTEAGIRDTALCSRVARKVFVQLGTPGAFQLDDLAKIASTFAAQEHRDLELLLGVAEQVVELGRWSPAGSSAAQEVARSFDKLEIDDVPDALKRAAAGNDIGHSDGTPEIPQPLLGSQAEFEVEADADGPKSRLG